jgi:hypothetical protein
LTAWVEYLAGDEGRARFRWERLRLPRDTGSLVEGFERDPWQREHFAIFDDPAVRLVFIEATRGFGKTTEAGALGVERIVLREDHDVLVIANDRDQARILSREASGFVQRDGMLSALCDVQADRILNRQNDSVLQVLSADAITNYGFGARPFTAVFDEFWAQPDRDLFDAIWSAVPKTPGSQVLILTNAGPARDGPAWEIREMCRASTDPALRFWSSAERGVHPSWIDPAEVERQRRTLPRSVFARLWLGEWGHGSGDFLTREQVETCIDPRLSAHSLVFHERRNYYLGLDLGLRHDRSVICVGHRERERFVVDHLQTWFATPENPVSLEDVFAHIMMLSRKIPRLKRGYLDPWQGIALLERAKRGGVKTIEEFTFTPQSLQLLSQTLWNAFRSGQISIPGYGPLVEELVTLRVVEKRYGWRLDHQSGGFSDHPIAVGLALCAAIGERGEIVVEDPRLSFALEKLMEKVVYRRRWGFATGKPLGLLLYTPTPTEENYYAVLRATQLMVHLDRMSAPEAESNYQAVREAARRDPSLLAGITDDVEDILGDIDDFLRAKPRVAAPAA